METACSYFRVDGIWYAYSKAADPMKSEWTRSRNMDDASPDTNADREMKTVVVHTVQGYIEAEIVQSCLRSYGIESTTQGLAAQSIHPFTVDGMGKIKVLVMEGDAENARQIIADFLEDNPEWDADQDL
jgi:hypothetical protein